MSLFVAILACHARNCFSHARMSICISDWIPSLLIYLSIFGVHPNAPTCSLISELTSPPHALMHAFANIGPPIAFHLLAWHRLQNQNFFSRYQPSPRNHNKLYVPTPSQLLLRSFSPSLRAVLARKQWLHSEKRLRCENFSLSPLFAFDDG